MHARPGDTTQELPRLDYAYMQYVPIVPDSRGCTKNNREEMTQLPDSPTPCDIAHPIAGAEEMACAVHERELVSPFTEHQHADTLEMPKRARSASPATVSDADTDAHDAPPPSKRRACSTPPRSPPLPPAVAAAVAAAERKGCALPLTLENLAQHTLAYASKPEPRAHSFPSSPSSMSSRSGSPARQAWDQIATLQSFQIEVDSPRALPTELQQHVDTVLLRTRGGPRSPNAKRLVQLRRAASLENESTGIRRLEPWLLFAGEDDPTAASGIPMISNKLNFNLSRDFLPPAPPGKSHLRLSQPQPDTIIGYLSNNQAMTMEPQLETAFGADEEEVLGSFTLNPSLLFPFLSSQWKSASGESFLIAHAQSARDGAAIVRYLDEFYTIAHGRPPTALECSHISLTCDMQVLDIWMHWRELDNAGIAAYYMKSIFSCTLRNEKNLLDARELLLNHVDYALQERLQSLKETIVLFGNEFPKRKAKSRKMSSSSKLESIAPFSLPPTPSSNYDNSEPVKKDKKRQRIE